MNTPIYDFVKKYSQSGAARFHMPGHKGRGPLGCEKYDITEIGGADVLYCAEGIIAESENNASELFGTAHSFYSAEGSTLAIKAMLAIALGAARACGASDKVLAARNAHSAFINACALLDLDVAWIDPVTDHICRSSVSAEDVRAALEKAEQRPMAVYLTSPDYLGNIMDIGGIAAICDEYGVPLLVDNAHGAYLAFLEDTAHPIALGAAMCADSAHKTLPVLTGGAYLHISKKYGSLAAGARSALRLFASTSPSYLTLCSLDLANAELCGGYADRIRKTAETVAALRRELEDNGMATVGDEPLKLTLDCHSFGYSGVEVACLLRRNNIECEFADNRYAVLMLTPENSCGELELLRKTLISVNKKAAIDVAAPVARHARRVLSVREAALSPRESVLSEDAPGRICASSAVACPPAVPIVVSGELIDESAVELLRFYGIESVEVVK